MPPLVRIPEGPITPHGAYHVLHNRRPMMGLLSYDNTVVINMLGGLAIPDRFLAPGRVEIKSLKGLIAPWRNITQKGATQDGVSFVTALGDPIEVEMGCRIVGRDPADCRRIGRYLYDSIDSIQEAELFWFTHEMGRWWAKVRWFQAPADDISAINRRTENVNLRMQSEDSYWRSYPNVDEFTFSYSAASDDFNVDDADDLGTGWTVALSGGGTGGIHVDDGEVVSTMDGVRTAVARKNSYTTTSDYQVVDITIGRLGQWFYPLDASHHIWARMNNSGTAGTSGLRLKIQRHLLTLSYFSGGVETVLRQRILIVPPLPGERFRLVAGDEENPRLFRVMRGAATLMTVKETGTGSPLGASNRSVGMGMETESSAEAGAIRAWSAGVNATVNQTGFLRRVNAGDQDAWDTYTVYGPGLFKFWNGPGAGANEYVEFGPLLPNQVAHIRTDPRRRGVIDMTAIPPTPQQLTQFQKALAAFLDFATGNNATPLAEEIKSWFGVKPPQGNLYSLLKGRWDKRALIPRKSAGKPCEPYFVKVAIDNGNADSKIIASLTPLRRMPY